jgi:hypothetical protein
METYWLETMQDVEEAYREAGYSQAQASIAAFGETLLPELQQMMALSRHLRDLQAQYLQNGDSQSAQSIAEIGIRLGTQMQENQGYLVIGDLVGMNIERRVLEGLDPHDVLVVGNQTIGDRLADLNQRKQTIGDIQSVLELLPNLPESEVSAYVARVKLYGELEAIRWLHNKHEAAVAKP